MSEIIIKFTNIKKKAHHHTSHTTHHTPHHTTSHITHHPHHITPHHTPSHTITPPYQYPLSLQKAYIYLGYKEGDFPITEELSKRVISLPMHTELEKEQIEFIAKNVIDFLNCN